MSEPRFLSIGQIERLHRKSIERWGGTHGLRDRGLFESAANHPRNVYHYGGDLFEAAAAYAFHIAQAQAFLDGNKRTAVLAAVAFLKGNGIKVFTHTKPLYHAMIAIAERRMDKPQLAALFRELSASR